jgi:hypothetical protein
MDSFDYVLCSDAILEAGRRLGVIERQRKISLPDLVESLVLAMSDLPGTQTTALVNYLSLTGQSLAPSSFYERFDEPLARLMAELVQRALRAVHELGHPLIFLASLRRSMSCRKWSGIPALRA